MAKDRLGKLLDENPRAAEDEEMIRSTLAALRKLRAAGYGGEGYRLAEPFGAWSPPQPAPKDRAANSAEPALKRA